MKNLLIGYVIILGLPLLIGKAYAADPKMDRNASLINAFQVFCMTEPVSFSRIDEKATALKLPIHEDVGQSKPTGYFAHSKSWISGLTTGPHELVATEANGPKGHIESCGISAPDPNGEDFMKEAAEEMKLGFPSSQKTTTDGTMRVTSWTNIFGEGTVLRYFDATPKNHPGIMLIYEVTTPTIQ